MSFVLNTLVSQTLIYFPDSTCAFTTRLSLSLKFLGQPFSKSFICLEPNSTALSTLTLSCAIFPIATLQLQVDGHLDSFDLRTLADSFLLITCQPYHHISSLWIPLYVQSALCHCLVRDNLKDPVQVYCKYVGLKTAL